MTFLAAGKANYRARISRASQLAATYGFAAEILGFYGHLAALQQHLYDSLPKLWGKRPVVPAAGMRSELNLPILLAPFAEFLRRLAEHAPAPLTQACTDLTNRGASAHEQLLTSFWQNGLLTLSPRTGEDSRETPEVRFDELFARAFLQPYAEFVSSAMLPPAPAMTVCRCPRCEALPLAGVLRVEGDGGKRFLLCSFCSLEWDFRRILCANCGEEAESKLPVYVAEQFPHIRVEACDTCRYFLRTIDLTKDGNAVPLVDDLAAIPLSLWAAEHGYTRIQNNLLGT